MRGGFDFGGISDDYDEEVVDDEEVMKPPAWLQGLMAETFFAACGVHLNRRKNEKNIFCLDCCHSFCPHCLPSHHSHGSIQVRRYVYQSVVRLEDLEKLIDCSFIQPYTINSAKVIFLNQREQSKSGKSSGNACLTCDRILQDPFSFCSLSCKVDYMVYHGEDMTSILYRIDDDQSDFAVSQFERLHVDCPELLYDDGQTTPNSILEDPLAYRSGSTCSYSNSMGNSEISMHHHHNQEHDQMMMVNKTKKKGSGFLPGIICSLNNRRKSAPHRSPLS
ncbi:OLC1v1025440C1 [Oldenlandia corymbosa var. corymbosa]|uniref:OLC1v1025440C1 n=1 Tax=Oldenlandia corymbosa var. corymbosa TaxID=529605 RepID=A0AAV1C4Q7_OLDCO|nr:OLC1v1025440C1 [Oldenlandia corymbosa var. corymbosa]